MKFIFIDNISIYIDLRFLKESYHSGNLKNADVFAKLFNLYEDNQDKYKMDYSMKKDTDTQNYTLFKDLDIKYNSWKLLCQYIKFGYIPEIKLNINDEMNDESCCKLTNILNDTYDISIKLGGIPLFDNYYNYTLDNIISKKECIEECYNPMTPEEDKLCKYNWIIGSPSNIIFNDEYCYTKKIEVDNEMYFMRKLLHK